MALSTPLGRCYFKRSSLKSPNGTFDAEDPLHFYSTMLIETIWNREAHHGSKACNSPDGHPHRRSNYKIVYGGGGWQTDYGNWEHLPLTYGEYKQPSRRVQQALCVNGYRFKLRERGDAYEAWYIAVPMPTRAEDWVFIDRLACIRAIYIPVAHQAGEKYTSLCTYLTVRFISLDPFELEYHKDKTPEKDAEMYDFDETVDVSTTTLTTEGTVGLYPDAKTALGINITRLVANLIVPEGFRKQNVFQAKGIILVDSSLIPVVPVQQKFTDGCMMDWAKIAGANHGLSIAWTQGDQSLPWFVSWMKNSFIFTIGWIPLIGPFLAAGSSVIFALIEDPSTAFDTLKAAVPSVELVAGIIEEIKNCAAVSKENVAEGVKFNSKTVLPVASLTPVSGDVTTEVRDAETISEKDKEEQEKAETTTAPAYKAIGEKELARMAEAYVQEQIKKRTRDMPKGKLQDIIHQQQMDGEISMDKLRTAVEAYPLRDLTEDEIARVRTRAPEQIKLMLIGQASKKEWITLPDNDYNVGKEHMENVKKTGNVKA